MWNRSVYFALWLGISGCASYYTMCKDGWIPFRGSCYLFQFEEMSFAQAELFCRVHENSHLVHVDDAIENQFLKDRMRVFQDHYWWMGLTDENIEGVWEWLDSGEIATFTDFKSGDGGNHNAEDCVAFEINEKEQHNGNQWVDGACSNPWAVLCEARGHEGESVIVG